MSGALVKLPPRPGCRMPVIVDWQLRRTPLRSNILFNEPEVQANMPISFRVIGNPGSGKLTFVTSVCSIHLEGFIQDPYSHDFAPGEVAYVADDGNSGKELGQGDRIFEYFEALYLWRLKQIEMYLKPGFEVKSPRFENATFLHDRQRFALLPSECAEIKEGETEKYKENVLVIFVDASYAEPDLVNSVKLNEDSLVRTRYHLEKSGINRIILAINKMDYGSSKVPDLPGRLSLAFYEKEYYDKVVDVVANQLIELCNDLELECHIGERYTAKYSRKIEVQAIPTSALSARNTVHGTLPRYCDWYQDQTILQSLLRI
ncbi:hypothetical protein V1512DRAFT_260627, partial [Lipomyces arxii]|uniref:uncharacterized protein n=1 Tax=Lipomyces arxii TaxID=56418 RepID=UPI0034CFEBAC